MLLRRNMERSLATISPRRMRPRASKKLVATDRFCPSNFCGRPSALEASARLRSGRDARSCTSWLAWDQVRSSTLAQMTSALAVLRLTGVFSGSRVM